MRITCPTCSAEYDVPGSVAPGRSVRCARCGNKWSPVPLPVPVIEAVPEPIPEPEAPPPPTPLLPPLPPKTPRRLPLLLAWIGSAVVIVALLAAAFILRGAIMHAWPPSIRVYSLLGLTARP